MHYEILVEDQSGKKMLDILVPKIIRNSDTHRIISYKGIGRIPKGLGSGSEANKRLLLDQLPKLLQGYAKSYGAIGDYQYLIVLVCDLDNNNYSFFLQQLQKILASCNPQPDTAFCIAIEEGEAWILGDVNAVFRAYPKAKKEYINSYQNDSICGTWEVLANAIYPGGSKKLREDGYAKIGEAKSVWAEKIAPYMDIDSNASPSFCNFRDVLR